MKMLEVFKLQLWFFLLAPSASTFVAASQKAAAFHYMHTFFMDRSPVIGVTYLGPAKNVSSTVSCAQHCLHDYTGCISFLFNSDTGLCTPSSTYNLDAPSPAPKEGQLYVNLNYCSLLKGFRLITSGGTTACIGAFRANATYDEADNLCQNKGGFLASVKTDDKLRILLDLREFKRPRKTTWVGCDDKVEEGTYVWKEDGESFNITNAPSTVSQTPDFTPDSLEDCLCLPFYSRQLEDFPCSTCYFGYVCEIALQSP